MFLLPKKELFPMSAFKFYGLQFCNHQDYDSVSGYFIFWKNRSLLLIFDCKIAYFMNDSFGIFNMCVNNIFFNVCKKSFFLMWLLFYKLLCSYEDSNLQLDKILLNWILIFLCNSSLERYWCGIILWHHFNKKNIILRQIYEHAWNFCC